MKIYKILLVLLMLSSCLSCSPELAQEKKKNNTDDTIIIRNSETNLPNEVNSSINQYINLKYFEVDEFPVSPTAPSPQPGKGAISGVIFSANARFVIPETTIYLVSGIGEKKEPPVILLGPSRDDMLIKSDINGEFKKDDIIPGTYYLVISSPPYDWALGYKNLNLEPVVVSISANEKIDLGIVFVYWP